MLVLFIVRLPPNQIGRCSLFLVGFSLPRYSISGHAFFLRDEQILQEVEMDSRVG